MLDSDDSTYTTTVAILSCFALIMLLAQVLSGIASASLQPPANQQLVSTSIPLNQYVRITSTQNSTISVMSLTGGQYDLKTYAGSGLTGLQFIPTNGSQYSLTVNVSGVGPNFAVVSKEGNPYDQEIRNVTGTGNIILVVEIATSPVPAQNTSWDPLFGITGIRLQLAELNYTNAIEIVAAIGVFFLALGVAFHSRITYLGVVTLSIASVMVFGILFLFAAVIIYFVGFATVNLVWRLHNRRARPL